MMDSDESFKAQQYQLDTPNAYWKTAFECLFIILKILSPL